MVEISTSILSVNRSQSAKTFYKLEEAHTEYFHIDVMDGKFVDQNNLELMKEYSNILKQISNLPLDVHLMVKNIKKHINEYIPLYPNIITFHIEATDNKKQVLDLIGYIKENGIKAGISIKPNTKIEEILEYLPYVHMVLIMTVEPGYGGQELIPSTIDKVRQMKEYIDDNNIDLDIEVDGGINLDNSQQLKQAGANILVVGTSIITSNDYSQTINKFKE